MPVQPPNPPPTRRFKRKLTPFLCQEMLYDYVVGALDAERKQAVEDFLPTDADTQRRLAAIKIGFIYTEKLSQFDLKPSVVRRLNEAESVVQMGQRHLTSVNIGQALSARLHLSPQALRATMAAFAVVLLVVGGSVVPWRSLAHRLRGSRNASGNAIELAPLNGAKNPVGEFGPVQVAENETANQEPQTAAETDGSGDEQAAGDEGNDEGVPQDLAAVPAVPPVAVEVPVMNVASAQPANPKPSAATRPAMADEAETAAERKETAPKGFVYRAYMTLDNIDDVADDIAKKIEDLGGEKAGEVELGWKKGEGRYYHFAMPEANQEKLLEELRAYGPVRISKDSHPRVMPKGRVRIILWVDTPK